MKLWITYLLIGISIQALGQSGTYAAQGFEWGSVLELKEDGTFRYFYKVSGCQGEITGKYELYEHKNIRFILDEEYTDGYLEKQQPKNKEEWEAFNKANRLNVPFMDLKPCYPNLNEGNWKFTRKGIKSKLEIECACLSTKGLLHRKLQ